MPRTDPPAAAVRRPARDIIEAVVDNMRKNLEPLKYSTLAPSRYTVYLHADEFARLEGIVPVLQEQTTRALAEELRKLNQRSRLRRLADRWRRETDPEIRNAGQHWHVEFLADPDGEMNEGDLLIDSELMLPASPDLGVGERTRRITTVHAGARTTTREQVVAGAARTPANVLARIEYEDAAGHHAYDVTKDSITIGRGGAAYPVDIRIASSPDVSREHARIRRDLTTGQFFLIDLSSLGTTLNGRHVPRGYDDVDGARRENGAETPLPDNAKIGLADTIFLEFTVLRW
ncbi:MAG TPA: FHA domain-containing protein [Vicinamibacterales bacterium]|nr:FHA domain-containing protein [Vicinamibacterales bacterium]